MASTGAVASGQTVRDLEPVDQAVEDVNPLSRSLRVAEDGLAAPQGFRTLYRLPGLENRYLRGQGAVFAVFPQSTYASTEFGDVPLIPPGTVFYIGLPALEQLSGDASDGSTERWRDPDDLMPLLIGRRHDRRAMMAAADKTAPSRPPAYGELLPRDVTQRAGSNEPAAPPIVRNATYRGARLRELLQRAASAELNDETTEAPAPDDESPTPSSSPAPGI